MSKLVPSDVLSVIQNGHSLVRSTGYLVKLLNLASEVVILELVKSKCLPILLYELECCSLRNADLNSLDFTHNRLFMKLFRTKSIDVVKDCQYFFGAVLPSVLVLRKADKT